MSIRLSIECDGDDCLETEHCDIDRDVVDVRQFKNYVADYFRWSFEDGLSLCESCTKLKEEASNEIHP